MGNFKDLTGQKFGLLYVIGRVDKPEEMKHLGSYWLCKCSICKIERVVSVTHLKDFEKNGGGCRTCNNLSISLINQKFGRLTVKGYDYELKKWECVCDCGRTTFAEASSLTKGLRISCGCKSGKYKIKNKYLRPILGMKASAVKRKIAWQLSEEEATQIITTPCFYCGEKASNSRNFENERIFYNGIDRLDSSLGYFLDNCVPCCWTCNKAKSQMQYSEFVSWIFKIFKNIKNKPLQMRDENGVIGDWKLQ